MNKAKLSAAILTITVLVTGCSSKQVNNTTSNNNSKVSLSTNVSNNANTEAKPENEASKKSNVYNYAGSWITLSALKSDCPFGLSLEINSIKADGTLSGEITYTSSGFNHISNIKINGKLQDNKFTCNFDNDGWDNKGTVILSFKNNIITLTITSSRVNASELGTWGMYTGTIDLYNRNSSVKRTITDLRTGGWHDVQNQCFDVNLNSFGKVRFLTETALNAGYSFYLADSNNIVYKFPEIYDSNNFYLTEISAISFVDINKDGLKDVIVIGKGKNTANNAEAYLCNVFVQKQGELFTNDKSLDDKINKAGDNTSVNAVLKNLGLPH